MKANLTLEAELDFKSIGLHPYDGEDTKYNLPAWYDIENPDNIFESESDKLKARICPLVVDLINYLGVRMLSVISPEIYGERFACFLSCSLEEAENIKVEIESWLALNKIKYWKVLINTSEIRHTSKIT